MPNIVKKLARQTLATSEGTLYTTPASTSTVVTNIVLTNTTASAITGTIKLGTHEVLSSASVSSNGILALDLRQVIEAGDTIAGSASAAGLKVHISGTEVS
jgi:hypothetical protein